MRNAVFPWRTAVASYLRRSCAAAWSFTEKLFQWLVFLVSLGFVRAYVFPRKMGDMKGPTDPLVNKVHEHQRKAYAHLSQALTLDESKSNLEEALRLYKLGMAEIERCVAVDLSHGRGEKYDRARVLQAKLQRNYVESEDRVRKLEAIVSLQARETEPNRAPRPPRAVVPPRRIGFGQNVNKNSNQAPKPLVSPTTLGPGRTSAGLVPKLNAVARARMKSPVTSDPARKFSSQKSREDTISKISSLRGVDTKLANMICDEILDSHAAVHWNDIVGQDAAKDALREMVILPALRPEFFTGLRAPARGLLLFGPPGNGKTMLAKAVATEAKSRFFNISASSLTSKWFGEGEKLVRALFAVANHLQPSIIFIDEVDSLLSRRREAENDAMKRLKTELLVQLDGVASDPKSRVILMGATNLPHELDHAALRRFTKRVYVQMPNFESRLKLLELLLAKHSAESRKGKGKNSDPAASLSQAELRKIADATDGYSGSDLTNLAQDAALEAIRECSNDEIVQMPTESLRPISYQDFERAMKRIRGSVPKSSLVQYETWNKEFGVVSS